MHDSKLKIAPRIETIKSDADFENLVRDSYNLQKRIVPTFNEFIRRSDRFNSNEYVFLPIELFKSHRINSEPKQELEFKSSGTTETGMRSTHFVYDRSLYEKLSTKHFEMNYGSLTSQMIIAYLPNYIDNGQSSLVHMVETFAQQTGQGFSPFISNDEEILKRIKEGKQTHRQVILIGVSFALLDWADKVQKDDTPFILMETGGMKGRRKELTREELHAQLKSAFPNADIHSEYGMTELLSQAYSSDGNWFDLPPWAKAVATDVNDPYQILPPGKRGLLAFVDLANIHSCSFIQTRDIGIVNSKGSFTVEGRLDNSDIRGCNLLHV